MKILPNIINILSLTIFFIILSSKVWAGLDQNVSSKLQIENYFQDLKTIRADFIQVSPSGNISNGKFYLQLPGKLRIDYEKPSDLLITCKGFWIVIQNRNSKTTNNIPLRKTPFSILLENKIDFTNKELLFNLKKSSGIISLRVQIAENHEIGELILEFSEKPLKLKKWSVKDVLGEETTVLIQNAEYNVKLPFILFFPDDFPEIND